MALTRQQVASRVLTMPERYVDRIPEMLEWPIPNYRNAGEWGLLVETLLARLRPGQIPISSRELQELRDLSEAMGLSTEGLSELPVRTSLSKEECESQLRSLPEQFAARIPQEDLRDLKQYRDSQEFRDLAEILLDSLTTSKVSITSQERDQLWLILDALDLPRLELAQLTVT